MIPVNKPFMPPLEEYSDFITEIWDRAWLTNDGPLVRRLEAELADFLGISDIVLVSNGTIAIQLVIRAMELEGKILTTPFSYVATSSSIVWEGCTPQFCDIDATSMSIDPDSVRAQLSDDCVAILATHVYGLPSHVEELEDIARQHGLKVIYDAAHCFGLNYRGKSLLSYGDASTVSFHATKTFHTIEGGGIITEDKALADRLRSIRNFGHSGPEKFDGVGTNAKLSEVHAAMGLVNLGMVDEILSARMRLYSVYCELLEPIKGVSVPSNKEVEMLSYMPIILDRSLPRNHVWEALKTKGVESRRYFYPLLSQLPYVVNPTDVPCAERVSESVLCLPFYTSMSMDEVHEVVSSLKQVIEAIE